MSTAHAESDSCHWQMAKKRFLPALFLDELSVQEVQEARVRRWLK